MTQPPRGRSRARRVIALVLGALALAVAVWAALARFGPDVERSVAAPAWDGVTVDWVALGSDRRNPVAGPGGVIALSDGLSDAPSGRQLAFSADADTWVDVTPSTDRVLEFWAVNATDDAWFVVAQSGEGNARLWRSEDGRSWEPIDPPVPRYLGTDRAGDGIFAFAGTVTEPYTWWFEAGDDWRPVTLPVERPPEARPVESTAGIVVCCSSFELSSQFWVSRDGDDWDAISVELPPEHADNAVGLTVQRVDRIGDRWFVVATSQHKFGHRQHLWTGSATQLEYVPDTPFPDRIGVSEIAGISVVADRLVLGLRVADEPNGNLLGAGPLVDPRVEMWSTTDGRTWEAMTPPPIVPESFVMALAGDRAVGVWQPQR